MSKRFAATLYTSRHLSTRTRWRLSYRCSRCLSTATGPALFRQLEDGTEQPIKEDDLFKYQRHRWLYNDAKEQDVRYRPFNVPALIERAINAKRERADGLTCVKILKLLEGDHNKVLLLTMSDGQELIARLPNPNAGNNRSTVASEIATRRFVQSVCKVPSPSVWDWDFRLRNTVGAEWIIESKAAGEPLRKHWFGMNRQDQLDIIEQVVDLEAKLAALKFSSHGSIYLGRWLYNKGVFRTKMIPNGIVNRDEALEIQSARFYGQFVIGPSTDRGLYRGPGDLSKQFRGPFKSLSHYARSLSGNEKRYVLNNPWAKADYITSKQSQQDPREYMELISKYTALQQHMIRPEFDNDPCTLSHPNLSLDNIWIDPITKKIVSLTGWQSTTITPPLLKRPYPKFLDVEFQTQSGDRSQTLPKERYRELVKVSDPLRYDRIFSSPQEYELLMGPISSIFNAWNNRGIFRLRESLLAVRNSKGIDLVRSVPELEQFSSSELESHTKEKYARQERDMLFNMIQDVQNTVKIPIDGRVLAEDFERAQELSEVYRWQYIDLAAGNRARKALHKKTWPFDSSEDVDTRNKRPVPHIGSKHISLVKKHHSVSKLDVVRKVRVD